MNVFETNQGRSFHIIENIQAETQTKSDKFRII